ncbi:MAG: hypothetical protein ACRC7R_02220 [Sarcina sp.]
MRLKSKVIAMLTGLALAFTGATGSYAYFIDKATSENNSISIGKFHEVTVDIYTSVGPMYSGMVKSDDGFENKATINYEKWLDNASNYVINEFNEIKSVLNKEVDEKQRFNFIKNDNSELISRKSLIGTIGEGNYSWMGSKNNAGEEYGSSIHHIVAISNGANNGEGVGKLNYKEQKLTIDQNQFFNNIDKNKEYIIKETSSEVISLDGKNERVRTFNWDNVEKKYIQVGEHNNPSLEADLIIFDIANRGYYTKGSTENSLYSLFDKIAANARHWQLDFSPNGEIITKILWEENSPMYPLVQQLVSEKEFFAGLVRTNIKVSYSYEYSGEVIDINKEYTINIGEENSKEEFNPDSIITYNEELNDLKEKLLNTQENNTKSDEENSKEIINNDEEQSKDFEEIMDEKLDINGELDRDGEETICDIKQ